MPVEVLEVSIRQVLSSPLCGDSVEFIWHGGEPLIAGMAFFRDALSVCERYARRGQRVRQTIQTNGLLLDPQWCTFLATNDFRVGVSIDGPKHVHDERRRTWRGAGSFDPTVRGIHLLQEHGIDPAALCVISPEQSVDPQHLIRFFVDLGIKSLSINLEEYVNDNVGIPGAAFAESYRLFIRGMFRAWLRVRHELSVREFDGILDALRRYKQSGQASLAPLDTRELGIITITTDGDIVPGDPKLAGLPNVVVGNVLRHGIQAAFEGEKWRAQRAQTRAGVMQCEDECWAFPVCGGTFTAAKLTENGSLASTSTHSCRLQRQVVTEEILAAAPLAEES